MKPGDTLGNQKKDEQYHLFPKAGIEGIMDPFFFDGTILNDEYSPLNAMQDRAKWYQSNSPGCHPYK